MAYAVVAFAAVLLSSWWAVESLQAGRAVDAQRLCEVDRSSPCLQQSTGILQGPYAVHRSANEWWEITGSSSAGDLEVGPGASGRLERWAGEEVTALTYRGDIAVVVTPDGRRSTDVDVGTRGVVYWAAGGLFALVAGVGLVRHARRRLRATGGWWRSGGAPTDFFELRIVIAGLPPLACGVAMQLGAPWQVGLSTGAVVAIASVVAAARSQRRARTAPAPRHARDPGLNAQL